MKILLISFSSLFFIFQQQIDIKGLKKDPILIEYKKVFNEFKDAASIRKYQLPANATELQKELAKNPSKENMKKLYKEAGMKNSDEYVDKLFLQTTLMFQFLQKHPEITKLDQQKKMEVFNKLLMD